MFGAFAWFLVIFVQDFREKNENYKIPSIRKSLSKAWTIDLTIDI